MSAWRRQSALSWAIGLVVTVLLALTLLKLRAAPRPFAEPSPAAAPTARAEKGAVAAEPPEAYLGLTLPRRSVDLAAPTGGEIVELRAHFGDRVDAGTTVARLEDTQLRQQLAAAEAGLVVSEARHQEAELQLRLARTRFERQATLAEEGIISAESLEETRYGVQLAEAASEGAAAEVRRQRATVRRFRESLASARLVAPFAGTVTVRYREAGESVAAGEPLLRLVSSEDLIVRFALPVAEGARLVPGSTVLVQPRGGPPVSAVVERIGAPVVASKLVIVEAMPNAGASLPEGLPVSVTVRSASPPLLSEPTPSQA